MATRDPGYQILATSSWATSALGPPIQGRAESFTGFRLPKKMIVKWNRPINVAEWLESGHRRIEITRSMLPGLRNQGRQRAGRRRSNYAGNIDRPIPLYDYGVDVMAFMTFAFLDFPDFRNYAFSNCQTFDTSGFHDFLISIPWRFLNSWFC